MKNEPIPFGIQPKGNTVRAKFVNISILISMICTLQTINDWSMTLIVCFWHWNDDGEGWICCHPDSKELPCSSLNGQRPYAYTTLFIPICKERENQPNTILGHIASVPCDYQSQYHAPLTRCVFWKPGRSWWGQCRWHQYHIQTVT